MTAMSSATSSNPGSASYTAEDYKVDKSVEFTYEELANCTNNFSVAHKIGEGGFATVYYGELRGQVCVCVCLSLTLCLNRLVLISHIGYAHLQLSSADVGGFLQVGG